MKSGKRLIWLSNQGTDLSETESQRSLPSLRTDRSLTGEEPLGSCGLLRSVRLINVLRRDAATQARGRRTVAKGEVRLEGFLSDSFRSFCGEKPHLSESMYYKRRSGLWSQHILEASRCVCVEAGVHDPVSAPSFLYFLSWVTSGRPYLLYFVFRQDKIINTHRATFHHV